MKLSIKYLKFYLLIITLSLHFTPAYSQSRQERSGKTEIRFVASNKLNVFAEPSSSSNLVGTLNFLDKIVVESLGIELTAEVRDQIRREKGIWVKIISPLQGYIFQKRLIKAKRKKITRKEGREISTESFLDKILGKKREVKKETGENVREEEYESFQESSFRGKMWINFGLGLIVLPEESGYSASIMDTMDFSVDYDYEPIPILKIRGGLNMSKSMGGKYETSTSSFYGALRFPFKMRRPSFLPALFRDPKFQGLAGLAYMITTLTSGGSGSSSSIGFLGGVNANAKFSEDWRLGAQFMLISGSTSLGGASKFVGSNQVQITIGKAF